MHAARLQDALERLTAAIRNVEAELAAMKAEHDPLATHIFVSRRHYRNANNTKSGKRREINAQLSFNTACELGFRGSLDEWERLMGRGCETLVPRARGISPRCRHQKSFFGLLPPGTRRQNRCYDQPENDFR